MENGVTLYRTKMLRGVLPYPWEGVFVFFAFGDQWINHDDTVTSHGMPWS